MIHITSHAISRYRERVEAVDHDTAHERIIAAVIKSRALLFRCKEIILGTGHHIVMNDDCTAVVTVRPKCGPPARRKRIREFEE